MANQTGRYSGKLTGGRPPEFPAGVKNGRLPLSLLLRCETQHRAEYPYLYAPAARACDAMTRAAAKDGVKIEAVALYRDFDGQKHMRSVWCARGDCSQAAVPGTSSHGWGTCIDFNRYLDGALEWMNKYGHLFGFDWPYWAWVPSRRYPKGREPWHRQWIQGFRLPEEIQVLLAGKLLPDADALMDGSRVLVALRPVTNALGALITGFPNGSALIDLGEREVRIPMEMHEGRGYVGARDLAERLGMTVNWNGEKRTVSLAPAA